MAKNLPVVPTTISDREEVYKSIKQHMNARQILKGNSSEINRTSFLKFIQMLDVMFKL